MNKYFSILNEKYAFSHLKVKEYETINKLRDQYRQIKSISETILNLSSPIGNREGALLMEKMDLLTDNMINDAKKLHEYSRHNVLEEVKVINTHFYHNMLITISVFCVLTIAVIIYGLSLTKNIINPIRQLIEHMNYVANGNFEIKLDIRANDEIRKLANSFNHMTLKLKESRKLLRESEEHKRELLNSLKDGIYQCEPHFGGVFTWVNHACAEMFGYKSTEEMIGIKVEDVYVDPGDRIKLVEKIENDEVIKDFPTVFKKKNGDFFHAERNSNMIKDENGKPVRIEGIIRDITERKKIEDQLRKLSSAVEQSPATVVITDTDGKIEYVNSKFTQLTGYSFEESIGENPSILKSGKQSPETYRELWETITTGNEWRGEFCNKKKNGELYWELASISPIKNDKGVITNFIAVKEDITRRKQIEEELRITHKMSSIGRLSASVFHEILNPVNIISAHTQLLLMGAAKGSKTMEDLKSIQSEIDRIVNITNNLLKFSMKEDTETETIEVNSILKSTLVLIMPLLNLKKIKSITTFDEDMPEVKAHGSELRDVFLKLITNSIEAMPEGGTLTVVTQIARSSELEIQRAEGEDTELKTQYSRLKGDSVRITFADTGCGIAKENVDKMFEPFFSTKKEIKGVGLGLSSSYAIIDGYGGRISVESEDGKGTTFIIDLPVLRRKTTQNKNQQ